VQGGGGFFLGGGLRGLSAFSCQLSAFSCQLGEVGVGFGCRVWAWGLGFGGREGEQMQMQPQVPHFVRDDNDLFGVGVGL